jgi:hypothetical protein
MKKKIAYLFGILILSTLSSRAEVPTTSQEALGMKIIASVQSKNEASYMKLIHPKCLTAYEGLSVLSTEWKNMGQFEIPTSPEPQITITTSDDLSKFEEYYYSPAWPELKLTIRVEWKAEKGTKSVLLYRYIKQEEGIWYMSLQEDKGWEDYLRKKGRIQ